MPKRRPVKSNTNKGKGETLKDLYEKGKIAYGPKPKARNGGGYAV